MALTAEKLRSVLSYEPNTGIFTWSAQVSRNVKPGTQIDPMRNHGHYVQAQIDGTLYYTHRLAWLYTHGAWPLGMIDHIDGNKTNNSIANLRDVNTSKNGQNQRKAMSHNKCGVLGVGVVGSRFRALINDSGKQLYLGTFDTPEEAHETYLTAKRKLHSGCTI